MTTVAAQRLIEASASLDVAQRALLSLWVNRGLSDEQIGRLVGVEEEAIASRRAILVSDLSETLGLPESRVLEALREIASAAHAERVARRGGSVSDPVPVTVPRQEAVTPVPERRGPIPHARSRRWPAIALTAAAAAAAAIIVILLMSGGGGHRRTPPRTGPLSATRAGARQTATLASLPGGPAGAHGQVVLSGPPGRQRLQAAITGLPPRSGGHYELWLYNSVLDSISLAQLSAPASTVTLALTVDPSRFRWIDVSFQPDGTQHHSGLSILRAAIPG